jgi:catechol 2,3-dioxygenase-like lactoylglutathione lyase family enzyme
MFLLGAKLYRAGDDGAETGSMIKRLDSVGVVVDDMEAAIAFFAELGMEIEGKATIEGPWVDRTNGLDDVKADIAMMRTPDGHSRIELCQFQRPAVLTASPAVPPVNVLGMGRIMFAVDDLEDVVARLRPHGGELIGGIARYEDAYLLCYVRGPAGIIVALSEELS